MHVNATMSKTNDVFTNQNEQDEESALLLPKSTKEVSGTDVSSAGSGNKVLKTVILVMAALTVFFMAYDGSSMSKLSITNNDLSSAQVPSESMITVAGAPKSKGRYPEESRVVSDSSIAIRCCLDNGNKLKMNKYGCKYGTYVEATTLCESVNARLCSLEEINDCKTCGTGCGFDNKRVWTSTTPVLSETELAAAAEAEAELAAAAEAEAAAVAAGDANPCGDLSSSNIDKFTKRLSECQAKLADGAAVSVCLGSSEACTNGDKDDTLSGSLTATAATVTGTASATHTDKLQIVGNFGFGNFLYALGRLGGGKDDYGDIVRNLAGPLTAISIDGSLAVTLTSTLTTTGSNIGFQADVTGVVSVQNDIKCEEPLSCALAGMIPKSVLYVASGTTALDGLEFGFSFTMEDIKHPEKWVIQISSQMSSSEVAKDSVWLRDIDGKGPKIFVKVTPPAPPAVSFTPGMSLPLDICVEDCQKDNAYHVIFTGELVVAGPKLAGALSMQGWWRKAMSIPILHLADLGLGISLAITAPVAPTRISPSGRFCLGTENACIHGKEGTLIAGAVALSLSLDPSDTDANEVFAAITETSLDKLLAIFEEGMQFPTTVRKAMPHELLITGMYPYSSKVCTNEQLTDIKNNLDCYAYMSFFQTANDVVISSSGRVNFLGSEMILKLDMSSKIDYPFMKIDATMTKLDVKNFLLVSKFKGSPEDQGPTFQMDCFPLKGKCPAALSGYATIPLMGIEGEVTMSMGPDESAAPLSVSRTTYALDSEMFGYDVNVSGYFNTPATAMQTSVSIAAVGKEGLANNIAKLLTDALAKLDDLVALAEAKKEAMISLLAAGCNTLPDSKLTLGPIAVQKVSYSKTLSFSKSFQTCPPCYDNPQICGPKICVSWNWKGKCKNERQDCSPGGQTCPSCYGPKLDFSKSFSASVGEDQTFMEQKSIGLRSMCEAGMTSEELAAAIDVALESLRKHAAEAKEGLDGIINPDQYFMFNVFAFNAEFDLVDVKASMTFDLDLAVKGTSIKVEKFGVAFDVDIEKLVMDLVIKNAVPILGQIDDFTKQVADIDTLITAKVDSVKTSATESYDVAKNALNEEASTATTTVTAKATEYTNGAKNSILSSCRSACPGDNPLKDYCHAQCNNINF